MSKSLGNFSHALHTQRWRKAEELAAKNKARAAVGFFIFPIMGDCGRVMNNITHRNSGCGGARDFDLQNEEDQPQIM